MCYKDLQKCHVCLISQVMQNIIVVYTKCQESARKVGYKPPY